MRILNVEGRDDVFEVQNDIWSLRNKLKMHNFKTLWKQLLLHSFERHEIIS